MTLRVQVGRRFKTRMVAVAVAIAIVLFSFAGAAAALGRGGSLGSGHTGKAAASMDKGYDGGVWIVTYD